MVLNAVDPGPFLGRFICLFSPALSYEMCFLPFMQLAPIYIS